MELNQNTPIKMRSEVSQTGLIDFCDYVKQHVGNESKIRVIVEIGSYTGESAVIFAKQFPKAMIYCVDPWTEGYDDTDIASHSDFNAVEEMFDNRVKDFPNIIKVKGKSLNTGIECDVVYIDGCHQYECVKEDIKHWRQFAIRFIGGHDYYPKEIADLHPHIKGVREAVDEQLPSPYFSIQTFSDGSWITSLSA